MPFRLLKIVLKYIHTHLNLCLNFNILKRVMALYETICVKLLKIVKILLEVSHLIHEEGILELEFHQFSKPNEIMDLDGNHQ